MDVLSLITMQQQMGKTEMKKKTARRVTLTPAAKAQILAHIKTGATAKDALEDTPFTYAQLNRARKEDPAFAEAWELAVEEGNDAIRDEIFRRGVSGVNEPVYHQGEVVGRKKKYSDTLLIVLAKSRMAEFREHQIHDHNVKNDGARDSLNDKLNKIADAGDPDE